MAPWPEPPSPAAVRAEPKHRARTKTRFRCIFKLINVTSVREGQRTSERGVKTEDEGGAAERLGDFGGIAATRAVGQEVGEHAGRR